MNYLRVYLHWPTRDTVRIRNPESSEQEGRRSRDPRRTPRIAKSHGDRRAKSPKWIHNSQRSVPRSQGAQDASYPFLFLSPALVRNAAHAPRACMPPWPGDEGRQLERSFSSLVTWPLVGVCLTFSMAVGKEKSTAGGPPPPPLRRPSPTPLPPIPPTITHASECKLPEAVNHFEKIPDSPRAPSLRLRCPFFYSPSPRAFLFLPSPGCPTSTVGRVLVSPSPAYVRRRTLPEKGRRLP